MKVIMSVFRIFVLLLLSNAQAQGTRITYRQETLSMLRLPLWDHTQVEDQFWIDYQCPKSISLPCLRLLAGIRVGSGGW